MVALWSVPSVLSAGRRSARRGMCLVLHCGSDLRLLLCTKKPPPVWPLHTNRTPRWGSLPNGKDMSLQLRLSSSGQKQSDPAKKFTQQWKSLMSENNAKSRRVGWRLCRSLWDRVLATGHAGNGQHQKHNRLWRGEAGSGVQRYFQLWWIFTEGPGRALGSSRSGDLKKKITRAELQHGVSVCDTVMPKHNPADCFTRTLLHPLEVTF